MSNINGPVFKRSRRLETSILENGKEFLKGKQRTYAPGQHGQKRTKSSEYKLHLYEKQKVRFIYGINERQFKNTFIKSSKLKGITGTNFLQTIESRLDNLVYRMGFTQTRREARQLVNHNHILLNGKKANIPSIQVSLGDTISLKEGMQKNKQILETLQTRKASAWLTYDNAKFSAKFDRLPNREELNTEINEALIVEYYNK